MTNPHTSLRGYLRHLARTYAKYVIITLLLLLLVTGFSILGPLIIRELAERYTSGGIGPQALFWFFGSMVLLYTCKFLVNRVKFALGERFKIDETTSLFSMIQRIVYQKHVEMEPTYLVEKTMGTIETLFLLFSSSLSGIFVSALTMTVILVLTFLLNKGIFLFFLIQIPLQYFGFRVLLNGKNSKLSRISDQLMTERSKSSKDIKAFLTHVDVLKQEPDPSSLIQYAKRSLRKVNALERKGNTYAMDVCTILEFLVSALNNGLYIYILFLLGNARISIADMVYLNLLNNLFFSSIGSAIDIQINIRNLYGALRFVQTELLENQESDGTHELTRIDSITGRFTNWGYGSVLIEQGEFTLHRGDIAGLTGDSGTGKSSIAKCAAGLIQTDCIQINNMPIRDIMGDSLRRKVFYMPQNLFMLPLSLRENITLGRDVTPAAWENLLSQPFMQTFLELPDGLETQVRENGANLSGGEKQKLMIARLMLRDPDVIILDEATSAIDAQTGMALIRQVIELFADRIIAIISHTPEPLTVCTTRLRISDKTLTQESA